MSMLMIILTAVHCHVKKKKKQPYTVAWQAWLKKYQSASLMSSKSEFFSIRSIQNKVKIKLCAPIHILYYILLAVMSNFT